MPERHRFACDMPICEERLIICFSFAINTIAFVFSALLIGFGDSFYTGPVAFSHTDCSCCLMVHPDLGFLFLAFNLYVILCCNACLISIGVSAWYHSVSEVMIGGERRVLHLVFGTIGMS